MALLDAVDRFPSPVRHINQPFLMFIENVLTITGRGTVVTGVPEQGTLRIGDPVEIVPDRLTVCTGIQSFNKELDEFVAGDNGGVLLRNVSREEVRRGQAIATPGFVSPSTRFEAQVYVLRPDEGGRHKPFFSGYRPQFHFRATDVNGAITLAEGDPRWCSRATQ
jgi:elongation factor Tu